MALFKAVKKTNGITLNYHRIAMIKIDTNQQICVLIQSYVDEAGRQYEKDYAAGKITGEPVFPYTVGEYLNMEYLENATLLIGDIFSNVYAWLKKQAEYTGAEDV